MSSWQHVIVPSSALRVVVVDGFLDKRDFKKNWFNQRDFVWTCFLWASDSSQCCSIPLITRQVFRKTLKSTPSKLLVTMISNNDLFCVLLKTRLLLYFYISVVCGGLLKKVKLVNKYTVTESVERLKWNPHREPGLQVFCCNLLFNQRRKLEKGFQIHLQTCRFLCVKLRLQK